VSQTKGTMRYKATVHQSENKREQLLKESHSKQSQIDQSLARTKLMATEAICTGHALIDELDSQNDRLISIKHGVCEVDDQLRKSNSILSFFRRDVRFTIALKILECFIHVKVKIRYKKDIL
jgi:hypothetical protein